jgi:hypothetical protein
VGSSYLPERAGRLGRSKKSLLLDDDCVAKSDYVSELFGSHALAPSKAFKKEAIAACCTPDGKVVTSSMLTMTRHNFFWTTAILNFCVPKTCQKQPSQC